MRRGERYRSVVLGVAVVALASLVGSVGCEPSLEDAACPPEGTTLTYADFGVGFFEAHCNRCHGGRGAYSARSFTSQADVRYERERIFAVATGENASMPPGPHDPPASERAKLAEWLACGAP